MWGGGRGMFLWKILRAPGLLRVLVVRKSAMGIKPAQDQVSIAGLRAFEPSQAYIVFRLLSLLGPLNVMAMQVWTYDGRHISSPRFQNLRATFLSRRAISLSEDAVAILDRNSPKCIRVCDLNTGRPLADGMSAEVEHDCEVVSYDELS